MDINDKNEMEFTDKEIDFLSEKVKLISDKITKNSSYKFDGYHLKYRNLNEFISRVSVIVLENEDELKDLDNEDINEMIRMIKNNILEKELMKNDKLNNIMKGK